MTEYGTVGWSNMYGKGNNYKKKTMYITEEQVKMVLDNFYNRIKQRLLESLREEQGIATEVRDKSIEIYNTIFLDNRDMLKKEVKYKCEFEIKDIKILVYVECIHEGKTYATSVYRGNMFAILNLYVNLGNTGEYDIMDSISHELNHIYQQAMAGCEYGNQEIYGYAASRIYSTDECERCLACIVYLSNTTEQDAYINGLYAAIMKDLEDKNVPIEKEKYETFKQLKELYACYDFLLSNKSNTKLRQSVYGYTKQFGWDIQQ